MLVLENVSKSFNDLNVLKNLNIEFKNGLNFILGPSGSGKSTLLKIISGMDKEYTGQVSFKGKKLKDFNNQSLNSYYYNSVGFIWQDFQLINHLSVKDNVKVALELSNLSNEEKEEKVNRLLKSLAIEPLSNKRVDKLSGGQKQRVAIARALVKDPEIIIADEPTGALDRNSSSIIMGVLKKISKDRIVIVVTHDKSLIDNDSNCFLLDKGRVSQIASSSNEISEPREKKLINPKLSFKNAFSLGIKNFKGLFFKFVMTSLILMLSSYFLILNTSGTVVNEQENILNELVKSKGNTLRDINIYSNVFGASGTDKQESNKSSLDIKQDVSGVLKKYMHDPRVEHIIPLVSLKDITLNIDGLLKDYKVEDSNGEPYVKDVIEGRLPKEGREIAVTKEFLKKSNLKPSDVIGKTLSLKGISYDWSTGQPKEVENNIDKLTIVGVVDSTISYKDPTYGDIKYEIEDSFIYSLDVIKELKRKSNSDEKNTSFAIRVKDVKDIMPIVEELSKDNITAMGEFETVSDILSINNTTKDQSGAITIIISVLAIVITVGVVMINALLRKREFSILKINGYSKISLFNLNIVENIIISMVAIALFIVASPAINNLSNKLFNMTVSGSKSIVIGAIIILIQGVVMGLISAFIAAKIKIEKNITTGDR